MQAAQIDALQGAQRPATQGQVIPGGIEEPGTQRREHPGASIRACTSADTQHHSVATQVKSRADHLADAERIHMQGIEPAGGKQP